MSDIKMSDVFPTGCCMAYAVSLTDDQVRYMDTAVKSYDANQELIDTLAAGLASTTNTIVRRDSVITKQQERIAKLEQSLLTLIAVASECDSWESFPEEPLTDALAAVQLGVKS